ncbi:MAG: hypothetical protein ABI665_15770 [Vicinamibacterales bacterium]
MIATTAYLLALALWIPLAIISAAQPTLRRRLLVPLVASVIAASYEAYMSLVWAPTVVNPIRVDALLVMFALGAVDAIVGFGLLADGRGRSGRRLLMVSGLLCLAVPALVIAAFASMRLDTALHDRNRDLARRFRFEANFRDDETEKRAFGELKPGKNPWAGYYLGIGDDDRFAHLVVNDEGAFWIYHSQLYESKGTGRPGSGANDAFEGVGDGREVARLRMTLRRQEGGPFLLDVDVGNIPNSAAPRAAPMRKTAPPRFPRPSDGRDQVRFAGAFSATYGELNNGFWLTQVWLWESDGKWWGQYLRDHYTHGDEREFISTERITPACSEQCRVLSFTTSRGPVVLTRLSETELTAAMAGERNQVTLKRGEELPGFIFDLAPLATKKENQEWIEALTTAGMITWKVP